MGIAILRPISWTELLTGRWKYTLLPERADFEVRGGTKVHLALAKEWGKVSGRIIEAPITSYLYEDTGKYSQIIRPLTGTPDMWWIEGDTLYIVEWKTKRDGDRLSYPNHFWNQLAGYGAKVWLNLPSIERIWIKRIRLEVWWFYRKKTMAASMKRLESRYIETTPEELYKNVLRIIRIKTKQPLSLAPANKGYIIS